MPSRAHRCRGPAGGWLGVAAALDAALGVVSLHIGAPLVVVLLVLRGFAPSF